MSVATSVLSCLALLGPTREASFRPPAVPLIVHDPYFSVWSVTDQLSEGTTRHWTGAEQPLVSLARIDGRTFRLMGHPAQVPDALPQERLMVTPTQTVYEFAGAGVSITLRFTTPVLLDNIEVLSRPATYLTWKVRATDGKSHDVTVYFSADARLAVNKPDQEVVWNRAKVDGLNVLRIGSEEQPVLRKKGDNLRIDWGHLLVAAPTEGYLGSEDRALDAFLGNGSLPSDEPSHPQPASENIVAAFVLPVGHVEATPVSRHLIVAYDDEFSIQFMGHNLRPYWRRNGLNGLGLIREANHDYDRLLAKCDAFDKELVGDLDRIGGSAYANIASLAYRQSLGAQKVVADSKGQPLMFSKENFSNGCIGTVDVLYPASPLLLAFSPTLTKASLVPILEYAASPRWKWPFAPHDLGTYPKANGQVYGGGERTEDNQMPVEESGNLLLILAALAHAEGNAEFSAKYWPQLEKWAEYLADKGFDPARQLSTDDFAGHLAHNVNLSAKAIEALGAYAYLAEKLGKADEEHKYRSLAEQFAQRWVAEGKSGDHYKLAFDKPDSWSQKYNLVWDRLLGLNLFPRSVAQEETAFYLQKQNEYGLPLDNRADYTKLDWIVWTATLTPDLANFQALVGPIGKFLNDTPDRVPMTDWYMTSEPKHVGFQARSVVGGVFIKLLDDAVTWKKYARRDHRKVGPWAPLPVPPAVTTVVPTGLEWHYTLTEPSANWMQSVLDASSWKVGAAGFGHGQGPEGPIRTTWDTKEIWIRREFDLTAEQATKVQLRIEHDDDADIYLNGVLAMHLPGAEPFETVELPKAAQSLLTSGRNVIAIHCRDTGGDSYIDAGFVTVADVRD
ncbi:MAG TPA: DUF4965 domain-containing protein [Fimbriimonas sp.]|nr:DUF4965 domain-containing protein [Fimbriimonas sp.]